MGMLIQMDKRKIKTVADISVFWQEEIKPI